MLEPSFIAMITYKTTLDGGRSSPVLSRYRPHVKFPFSEHRTTGQQTFLDKEIVYPGETVKAEVAILAVDVFANCLEEGMEFEVGEGSRVVATGRIIEILDQKLIKK